MTLAMNRRAFLAGTAVVAACAAMPNAAFAQAAAARTNYAVLIGVTKYPNVRNADLVGPANDAVMVREYLLNSAPAKFDPTNVLVLADEVEGATASPSKQNIMDTLAGIASRARRGDLVYIQMSGHGIQQPAVDPASESDGMDEVFLPNDISDWKDRSKGIPNAFTDNEIGQSLDRIRATGAFVWIVMDCCNSGTATRAAGLGEDDVRERKLNPEQLAIPAAAFAESIAAAQAAGRPVPGEGTRGLAAAATTEVVVAGASEPTGAESMVPGGMVAFFAAQTVETTPEMPLPRGVEGAKKYGLFTYTLFEQLAKNPNVTYRQLGQSIMQAYSAANRTRPTPLFEGKLDVPAFGTEPGDAVQQWPLAISPTGLAIPAGRLHRLSVGTRLALLSSPAAPVEEAFGYVEVRSVENLTAKVAPVEFEGKKAPAAAQIVAGTYARLLEVGFDTELVVSMPPESSRFGAEVAQVRNILSRIVAGENKPLKLKLVEAREPADIKLAVLSEEDVAMMVAKAGAGATSVQAEGMRAAISNAPRLWFLPPTAEISLEQGRRPPSIGFAGSTPEGLFGEVSDNLIRIFRATNLARLATASNFKPEEFEVTFRLRRPDNNQSSDLLAGTTPRVRPFDEVYVTAANTSGKPIDINVLYIGSDYSISHMHAERLHPGSKLDNLGLLFFNDKSFGIERMVVVLTEGSPLSPMEDLSFLAQEGVRVMTRAVGAPQGFSGLLRDIADAPATRGAMKLNGPAAAAKGGLMIFSVENMPAA
ncbi:MAG: caspase family protein [Rhizobiaceae bacterium]|nr:caspase family protein [Rhizobiaceae bacterium]